MDDRPGTAHQTLVEELAAAILAAEGRAGRSRNRKALAKSIHVSASSLYAYLNGTTVPPSGVLTDLAAALGVAPVTAERLHALRDRAALTRRVGRGPRIRSDPPPRQLPPVVSAFVGRAAELAAVRDLLATPPRVVVIDGMPGVGKTTLAIHAASEMADRFPDGQLYADLAGFANGGPIDPAEVLHSFLIALGVPSRAVPARTPTRSALFRSHLAGQRVLVLLDNVRSADDVLPLLPNHPGCAAIVTGRHRLDGLTVKVGAKRVGLNLPTVGESLLLLGSLLPAERLRAEPEAASDLVDLCAQLPLALSVAAAYVQSRPGPSLRDLVRELRAERGALGIPGSWDIDIARVFRWSYDVLARPAQRLFRRLGLHPGPTIDWHGCAALLGHAAEAYEAIGALHAASLVGERQHGRFHLHDLLRAYASGRLSDDSPFERQAAVDRMLELYLGTAIRARALIQPPAAAAGGPGSILTSYGEAMAWFADEIRTLRSLVSIAMSYGRDEQAWQLAWTCSVFLRRTGRHQERAEMQQTALLAAERSGDDHVRATTLRLLADALNRTGHQEEAMELLTRSIKLSEAAGELDGVRQAHLSLVRVLGGLNRHVEALDHATRALELANPLDDAAVADGYTALAKQQCRLGRYSETLANAAEAVKRYRKLTNREGIADITSAMGRAELGQGHHGAAIDHFKAALDIDLALNDRYWAARTLVSMAEAYDLGGDRARAAECRKRALNLFGHQF
ncbi:hypothetical protein GCM10022225_83300 [Plantactinospora mayteni]|uniref:HTH cro/C1-type domain-containing protein n=1 Tax=Plantactinospora mayteni TaxID=566021 RepID=A0ABQ4F4F1_9ACTN|nr:tetratricopeptide repeat protein [Plantactinospora mayteni]GIH01796.1 hypothetical protein Pma05_83680 [Plantactinospora mayteni]